MKKYLGLLIGATLSLGVFAATPPMRSSALIYDSSASTTEIQTPNSSIAAVKTLLVHGGAGSSQNAGRIACYGGDATGSGNGGSGHFDGGYAVDGNGGEARLLGGGTTGTGTPANAVVQGGDAEAGTANGGDVVLTPGASFAGTGGKIILNHPSKGTSGDCVVSNGTDGSVHFETCPAGAASLTSLSDGTALPASGLVSEQFKTFGTVTLTAGTWMVAASAGVFNGASGAPTTFQICLSAASGNNCTGSLAVHTLGLVTHNFPTPSTCGSNCWVDYIGIPGVLITVGGSTPIYFNVNVADANISSDQVGGYIRAVKIAP